MADRSRDDFDEKAMIDRGTVAGAFCRRKGYSVAAAKSMLGTQATFLATDMQHLSFERRAALLKLYADAYLAAFAGK